MRIKQLDLKTWHVIREVLLEDLSDFVVIAGPNGVGKTKIKDAICHIFQNNGNPPAGSSVTLEATNQEEIDSWGSREITLPHANWLTRFSRRHKKLNTSAQLIQIDSARQIETVQFQQKSVAEITTGDEDVDYNYSSKKVKDRFVDICNTLLGEKQRLIFNLGNAAHTDLNNDLNLAEARVQRQNDPTKKFEDLFDQLLYPKKMVPIEPHSTTIQYTDEEGVIRSFSDLSSGEREVIVITFDILLQNPSDSIIVIDEPELHLHPELAFRLVKVLKIIGERNQFFLFTHSADVIGNSFETGVYFIRPKSKIPIGNQAIRVDSNNLGDLALIPNLRETIGTLSLGKKLLFVEGTNTSIDRNVFATLAKTEQIDLAIIPSDSCENINNMSLIADTLSRGVFGIDLFMVRDRDSLTDAQVGIYKTKSNNRLVFLPFYHIENVFLDPAALHQLATNMSLLTIPTLVEISNKLTEYAREQLNDTVILYVKNEIRFKAGNMDITPEALSPLSSVEDLVRAMNAKKDTVLSQYQTDFSESYIKERVEFWHTKLSQALQNGWSPEARQLFYGKSILPRIKEWIFGTQRFNLPEAIINDQSAECQTAMQPLRDILSNI